MKDFACKHIQTACTYNLHIYNLMTNANRNLTSGCTSTKSDLSYLDGIYRISLDYSGSKQCRPGKDCPDKYIKIENSTGIAKLVYAHILKANITGLIRLHVMVHSNSERQRS